MRCIYAYKNSDYSGGTAIDLLRFICNTTALQPRLNHWMKTWGSSSQSFWIVFTLWWFIRNLNQHYYSPIKIEQLDEDTRKFFPEFLEFIHDMNV